MSSYSFIHFNVYERPIGAKLDQDLFSDFVFALI